MSVAICATPRTFLLEGKTICAKILDPQVMGLDADGFIATIVTKETPRRDDAAYISFIRFSPREGNSVQSPSF